VHFSIIKDLKCTINYRTNLDIAASEEKFWTKEEKTLLIGYRQ